MRNDIHRPSQIAPTDYRFVDSYFTWISYGDTDCQDYPMGESDLDVLYGIEESGGHFVGGDWHAQSRGNYLPCGVCGTRHKFGAAFLHIPSGEHILMGQDCAAKYNLANGKQREAAARDRRATYILRMERRSVLREFVATMTMELRRALRCKHGIVQDIRSKLIRYCAISEKQAALVLKLAAEADKPVEKHVPAPIAATRQTVKGTVVSCKLHDYFGSIKMTVKVATDDGSWLCWGTAPESLLSDSGDIGGLRGCTIRFDAKLKAGRDEHFALFSRPTKAIILTVGEPGREALARIEAELAFIEANEDWASTEYTTKQATLVTRLRELVS